MAAIRFNVFGRIVLIERKENEWRPYYPSNDGKRRPASFVIPSFIEDRELEQYLGDIFHESASPNNPEVVRLK